MAVIVLGCLCLPALAKDLVKDGVKVIAAGGPPSIFAAAAATSKIPIVAAGFSDATLTLIGNINHPQGNVTGFSTFENAALHGKRLELLRELVPSAATVAVLSHPGDAVDSGADVNDIAASAHALGMTLSAMTAENEAEIEAAFKAATDERADALLITGAPFFTIRHDRIVALAAHYHLPAIYAWREYAAAGGLITYASSLTAVWRGTVGGGGVGGDTTRRSLVPAVNMRPPACSSVGCYRSKKPSNRWRGGASSLNERRTRRGSGTASGPPSRVTRSRRSSRARAVGACTIGGLAFRPN
jgi:hypothetical protein